MNYIFSLEFIKKVMEQNGRRDIKGLPEQIAFNLVMAIVPLLVVIVQLGTYLSVDTKLIEKLIVSYAPEQLHDLLYSLFATPAPSTATTIFILTTGITFFWLISKGFYGIANAANTTYQVPLMKFAYLERIMSFFIVLVLIMLLAVVLILFVFGQLIVTLSLNHFDISFQADWVILFNVLKALVGFSGYFLFFTILFYLAPNIKMSLVRVIPGALVTSVGWSIASLIFSFYANHIANYNKFYGSLSIIIILLFWLYILGYTIVIGLQVNYILQRDYFGGVKYIPRLNFINRFKLISKYTNYDSPN